MGLGDGEWTEMGSAEQVGLGVLVPLVIRGSLAGRCLGWSPGVPQYPTTHLPQMPAGEPSAPFPVCVCVCVPATDTVTPWQHELFLGILTFGDVRFTQEEGAYIGM